MLVIDIGSWNSDYDRLFAHLMARCIRKMATNIKEHDVLAYQDWM